MRIGNLMVDGRPKAMTTHESSDWHIDNLYKAHPHEATALFAVKTPSSGGDTIFTSLRAAFDALDEKAKKRIEGMRCVYSVDSLDALHRKNERNRPDLRPETVAENPPVSHPLVRVDNTTGNRSLFFSEAISPRLKGLSEDETKSLISSLAAHATSRQFQYCHRWKDGDLLMWDNLSTMHRATSFDSKREQRLLYRAMIGRIRA